MSDSADGETTPPKAPKTVHLAPPWQPGQSGNPAGRPKGSRHKLGEAFVEALQKDFAEHGNGVIEKVRNDDPTQYLKVIAAVIPKEVHHTVEDYDGFSDDELADQFAAVAARLSGRDSNGAGARAAPRKGALPH